MWTGKLSVHGRAAAETPGVSVKVETTGAYKDKERIAEEEWAVVRASRKSAVPHRETSRKLH